MGVLSNLEPSNVFHYFEEITKIPHGSGNVDKISEFLVQFAKERNLFYIQDEWKNVIIVKDATEGYEKEPAVILQGHMDMVAVSKPGHQIDLKTEGLRLKLDGDKIFAEGTSLGGDDGIAVAYALAILDSDTMKHPRLEVVITADEEVGMDGAREIDLSMLQGHTMLNLDSEEEGIFLTSCAGGARVACKLPLQEIMLDGVAFEFTISGLLGGHSGGEIHKGRGNSNCIFGRVLWNLTREIPVGIAEVQGGLADNAIPRETKAILVVKAEQSERFHEILRRTEVEVKEEFIAKDAGLFFQIEEKGEGSYSCSNPYDTTTAAAFLFALPNGVQSMSAEVEGLVETSLNMGILEKRKGGLYAEFAVRSSIESAKQALIQQLAAVVCLSGGTYEVSGEYPGWKYRSDSPLRDKMVALYEEMYGTKPVVEGIHAGLECGILGSKITDLDCVSFGPDMKDIHTTEESLSVSSTKRVWEYLVKLLEKR